ncbi:MAG: NADH-quinone oxidoreductase subunit M [Cocleimonas sp.]|nr:NADH-quinone oxidoreductase subunit M [Cocleimonas sp.]
MLSSLLILLLLPLVGAVIIGFLPNSKPQLIRNIAIVTSSITLFYAIYLITLGDVTPTDHGLWQNYHHTWNTRMGTSFSLGVDGFSYPLVILTTLLVWIAVLASKAINHHPKGYYLLMLVLSSAIMGVFMARDWALFYVFWEATLIPLFFLIDRWGGQGRQTAALNFVLYTMGGSVFMLLSLLVLFDATGGQSFSFEAISEGAKHLKASDQVLIFMGLLIGFGVKMPIFPLHGWLPLAHVEAPSPVSILLSGILLKMGAYGLIRAAAMLPDAAHTLQPLLVVLALIAISYGSLLAWKQSDLKKMIAYSSVAHMGVVLLGISTLNTLGMTGAVYQMVAHGLVAGASFMLIGLLYERTHTKDINDYGSLLHVTPRFAFFTIFAFIAGVGLPGTAGFVAELHVMIGSFQHWGWIMVVLAFGIIVSATYSVRTIKRLFTGPAKQSMKEIDDLRPTEVLAAAVLMVGVMVLGLYPSLVLDLISPAVHDFIEQVAVQAVVKEH